MNFGLLGREVPLVSADPFNNEAFARGMDFSLQVQAHFAWAEGDAARAVQLLEQARERAGEAWTEESEKLLASWRAD